MAIAFDNASSANVSAVTNFSWTHTATGANLFACTGVTYLSPSINMSAVAYGGVALTSKASIKNDNAGATGIALVVHALTNVSSGNNTISMAATGSGNYLALGLTYTGVDSTIGAGGAVSTASAPAGTSPFNLSVQAQNGQMVVGFAADVNNFGVEAGTQTRRAVCFNDANPGYIVASDIVSGGTTVSFSWTASASLTSKWLGIGFGFSQTAVAAANFIYCMNLLGVGM
jgi:hypothetical protein